MASISEIIFSGFVSKVVNNCVDVSRDKIKEADKNRKSKSQNIQTRIYQVIIDAINIFTYNQYKNQNKLYDAAETLLNGFKKGVNNQIESVKSGLNILIPDVDNNTCERFIETLRCEVGKEANFDLYKEILLILLDEAKKDESEDHNQIKLQLEQINKKLDEKNEENIISIQSDSVERKIESKTQEYSDKWNQNMFLNDFDEWDEKVGVNVKLSDVYLDFHLPHFIYGENEKESTDLIKLLTKYIEKRNANQMLLILGQPGIGKSTLITWITANFHKYIDEILVYRFASDLKNIEWNKDNISKRILGILDLSYTDLNGKVLILDGYDEINVKDRREILDQLYWNLVKNNRIKNFSLIVTCRVNYIQEFERVKCRYITLQPWNEEQIKSFCEVFQEKTNYEISEHTIKNLISNNEIFGIPLILYMVLALNISIEKESSVVEIYDKIFALDGGIYDRCIENKSFADPHRISKHEIKKQIHRISREIALWMFENNFDEANISQKEYQKICSRVIQENAQENKDIERDFMIGNFFRLKHCEGKESHELLFVHRSIFEYFVVEYIYSSICEVIHLSKQDIASVLGKFLTGNILSRNMLEYFKIKILNGELREKFEIINDVFQLMLQDGMTYHTSNIFNINYKNVIDCEMNVFVNMLEILHLWEFCDILELGYSVSKFIRYNYQFRLNLVGAYLNGTNLSEANLSEANLIGAYLNRANLNGVNLSGANLMGASLDGTSLIGTNLNEANLNEADLNGANLKEASLNEANLSGANLNGADLNGTDLRGAYLDGVILDEFNIKYLENKYNLNSTKIYISSIKGILTYKEYCKRKHRD